MPKRKAERREAIAGDRHLREELEVHRVRQRKVVGDVEFAFHNRHRFVLVNAAIQPHLDCRI